MLQSRIFDKCYNGIAHLWNVSHVPKELAAYNIDHKVITEQPLERQVFLFLVTGLAIMVVKWFYKLLFCPMVHVRPHGSVGFLTKYKGLSQKEIIRDTIESKDVGKIPPVFPNGWYKAIESPDVQCGDVKRLNILGKNLAVYRTKASKKVHVIGTYCPHLGADFSVGGRVVGDCIVCPFHGWQFGGDEGKVQNIPYSNTDKLSFVKLDKWHSCEKWGWVYVWYHVDGIAPQYELPEYEEFDQLKFGGCSDHIVDCHIEDIPENAADSAHLAFLHKPAMGTDLTEDNTFSEFLKHDIKTDWRPSEEEGKKHLADVFLSDDIYVNVFGHRLDFIGFRFNITQIGPGVVHIKVRMGSRKFFIIQTVTPLKPLQQRLHQDFYFEKGFPLPLAKIIMFTEIVQIERDISVWTNKTYPPAPKLTREERVIADHRRWYSQFYSENSLCLTSTGDLVPRSASNKKQRIDF